MSWQKVHPLSSSPLTASLAFLELRLVLAHSPYLFDAQLVPGTDAGYHYCRHPPQSYTYNFRSCVTFLA
jgi:hypothetical protein